MSRRPYIVRVKCGHADCTEFARYGADTRADELRLHQRYGNGQYRCTRHSQPNEVLSATAPRTVTVLTLIRRFTGSGADIGLFWNGSNGFAHGPGFKAFGEDFPEGTRLIVTAEIVLPEPKSQEPAPCA